ncbi:MAG: hypothetical protein ACJA13_003784 [Paraglaciecola sp.]|jgi:uncharacterized protein (TIGR03503 family)
MLRPLVLCLLFCIGVAPAQQDTGESESPNPLTALGTDFQNSIILLQNRFRIDHEVKEITMVFFRQYGSVPVVLVRPDGSKIYQSQADDESLFWFDSSTYDMINIKNPMPGPWQAVGDITPESRVMVISDLQLHGEPLPEVIFAGEILKQSAYLSNGGQPIDYAPFRDVVSLNMEFLSTNNPDYNNFGADPQTIASFEDNGKGMDEKPLDGTFTGQFNLSIAAGQWTPNFVVSTPMFTREQLGQPVMLFPNPIAITVEQNGGGGGYHKLLIDADREFVDMSTLLIDGKIQFPNGDIQNFSITEMTPNAREYLIVDYEYGVFRVKLTAFGNTVDGRDFILDVPEFSFLTEEALPPSEENIANTEPVTPVSIDSTTDIASQPVPGSAAPIADEQDMSTSTLVTLIVSINLFLLIVGGGLIWFITKDKKIGVTEPAVKAAKNPKPNVLDKLKAYFTKPKVAKNVKKSKKDKASADTDDSGIVNLDMPKN